MNNDQQAILFFSVMMAFVLASLMGLFCIGIGFIFGTFLQAIGVGIVGFVVTFVFGFLITLWLC